MRAQNMQEKIVSHQIGFQEQAGERVEWSNRQRRGIQALPFALRGIVAMHADGDVRPPIHQLLIARRRRFYGTQHLALAKKEGSLFGKRK
jgi:hypothetical protein